MKEKLNSLRSSTIGLLSQIADIKVLNDERSRILGRKGDLTALLRGLKDLPIEERASFGQLANKIKTELEAEFDRREISLRKDLERSQVMSESFDVTLPGRRFPLGCSHILNRVTRELVDIFSGLGFQLAEGPEVEIDYYNFEAL
ncbi:MAG: phenylalanine--tRNA ligase subunit alpha, partial [Pseudomonadota bacterium]